MDKSPSALGTRKPRKQRLPRGWTQRRIKALIAHFDKQTEDEELAEYEAAMKLADQGIMLVPTKLVPEIRKLIARRQSAR